MQNDQGLSQQAYRSRGAFRSQGQSVESEDGPLHLRQKKPHPYYQPESDREGSGQGHGVPRQYLRHGPAGSVRGDEAPDQGDRPERFQLLRYALRFRALARRHAHQLPDDSRQAQPSRGARGDGEVGQDGALQQEDPGFPRARAEPHQEEPGRHPRDAQASRRHGCRRSAQREDRRPRGQQARHPGDRRSRHGL